jgi:hypothetical protein
MAILALFTGLIVDNLFYSTRKSLQTSNTGRWAIQEWKEKQISARARSSSIKILFLGDSTMSRDLRPGIIHPSAQNIGRSGLQGIELTELSEKIEQLGILRPSIIILSMLPEQFRDQSSDRSDLLRNNRPGLKAVILNYYAQPNLSQLAFLPGTRVAKYHIDSVVAGFERDRTYRIDADGAFLYSASPKAAGAPVWMPNFISNSPGFLNQTKVAPLEAFVRYWEARGTRMVYLYLPLHPSIIQKYESRFGPDLAYYEAEVRRIFHNRVIKLEVHPVDTDFYDATHLNAIGAARYSLLVRDALQPYFEEAGLSLNKLPREFKD